MKFWTWNFIFHDFCSLEGTELPLKELMITALHFLWTNHGIIKVGDNL